MEPISTVTVPIHPRIDKLVPYEAGIRPEAGVHAIKLNQNESPYPASPKVEESLRGLGPELLRQYPDGQCVRLRSALADLHGIPPSTIACGNGSSELITLLFRTFIQEGDTVAVPDPTFALYATAAEIAGATVCAVPTDGSFRLDPEALAKPIPRAIFLANPNAPTGLHVEPDSIERLLRRFSGLVVVDEAYVDFAPGGTSVLKLTARYSHLVVLRTFSKAYALPGARVGYAVANGRLIQAMEKARETFNVNVLAQLAAEAAVSDTEHRNRTVSRIRSTRDRFATLLREAGWETVPSSANFLLVSPPRDGRTAKELYSLLAERHIYVRYFDAPRLRDWLRISIGTDPDMDAVAEALADLNSASS